MWTNWYMEQGIGQYFVNVVPFGWLFYSLKVVAICQNNSTVSIM